MIKGAELSKLSITEFYKEAEGKHMKVSLVEEHITCLNLMPGTGFLSFIVHQ